jgi:hypothetical protein
MNWKLILTAGALAGVAIAARRRSHKAAADGERWSAVTDPVTPAAS